MSDLSAPETSAYKRKRMLGLLLVLLGGLLCLLRVYANRHLEHKYMGIDFRAVYGSTRCVVAGCNPYYFADMRAQFLAHGGSLAEALTPTYGPFMPHYVGYPPPTLFYLVPFVLLNWPLALFVFMGVSIALYAIAALLFADLCSEHVPLAANVCLALFLASSGEIVKLGQPTLLAAALACIGLWCLLKDRCPWVGVVSFALSMVFKPHLGAIFLLYFLLATKTYRKRALQIIGLTIVLSIPSLLWFAHNDATRHWIQDYRENIAGIATPGNLSDPGPRHKGENHITDLQTLISVYRDEPSFYNHVAWAISAVVLAGWLYVIVKRPPSREKDLLCIAGLAAFSMLPIYHRLYDCRIFLVLFPPLALLMQRSLWWGRAATVVTVWTIYVTSDFYTVNSETRFVQILERFPLIHGPAMRALTLTLLGVTLFYLAVLYLSPPELALETELTTSAGSS
jgi:hypothetical protein